MPTKAPATFFGKAGAVTSGDLQPTEDVLCPLCKISPQPFAVDYQGFTLCRCPQCTLEFVTPRLSFDELADKVYSDNYFPKRDGSNKASPETSHYICRQLADFERLLGDRKKVLDVGCGNGAFLDFAREAGWSIAGADIKLSPDANELKCPLWEGRLQDIDFCDERFDLIRLNHVLEHTQDPLQELRICKALLEPKGILYLSVPNINGISPRLKSLQSRLRLKSNRWRHYAAMHHLFFFSPETLCAIVERAGFRVLDWNTPVPKKNGQSVLVETIYRNLMERTHSSSILDLYCTPDDTLIH
ncbi:MAG: class I SAM-dependent methyltransferase [Chloracidobacterium sp.]|nr:class I SAM-dependent methyltransferase [Chloracidobacterium sp.]